MFYKLGLSLYSHTKFSLLNIDTNSIVASEQYFSTQESFSNNSFIITESGNADIDFLSQLEYFTYKGFSKKGNMFLNVTLRVSIKQLNKVTSSRKIYKVAKLVSYNFEQLCLT